jgi:hypothetical protein
VAAAIAGASLLWGGCTGDDTVDTSSGTTASGGSTSGQGGGGGGDACPGATQCGDACTNLEFDPQNCGACGNACPDGELCSLGQCGVSCLGGSIQCGELCVNLGNDPDHCGACDSACDQGQLCASGGCVLSCEDGGATECSGLCVNTNTDTDNCGACDNSCGQGEVCISGSCTLDCVGGTTNCSGQCVDTDVDKANCGACSNVCGQGELCSLGVCNFECIGGTTECSGQCIDTDVDPQNCGSCGNACGSSEVCNAGSCASVCGGNLTKCGNFCVDVGGDDANCGACGNVCASNESCTAGTCVACDSNTTDCDGDGWKVADGDCCDVPGSCGLDPELVNPGAIEVAGNNIDDNCNTLVDLFDAQDTLSCDANLVSNSTNASDYAKALGVCRTTTANPTLPNKTWGLIEAELLTADGSPLPDARAASIRNAFGSISPGTVEGQRSIVLSSGIAADLVQTSPGPIGGASNTHSPANNANIATCTGTKCIKDWFQTANPPLKNANELPVAPNCGTGTAGGPSTPNDSVMLRLKLRAPTNAKSFSFNSYFMSAEYPEYVCSNYNDQFIVLVDTTTPATPIPNPIDKNLMTYNDGNQKWPIGINIAKGTSLFSVCETQQQNPGCWDTTVSPNSCFLGAQQLQGTGFGKDNSTCTVGGGTFWLTTSGNIVPGGTLELRIVVWDVGDHSLDSLAVLDGLQWLPNATVPGTDNN